MVIFNSYVKLPEGKPNHWSVVTLAATRKVRRMQKHRKCPWSMTAQNIYANPAGSRVAMQRVGREGFPWMQRNYTKEILFQEVQCQKSINKEAFWALCNHVRLLNSNKREWKPISATCHVHICPRCRWKWVWESGMAQTLAPQIRTPFSIIISNGSMQVIAGMAQIIAILWGRWQTLGLWSAVSHKAIDEEMRYVTRYKGCQVVDWFIQFPSFQLKSSILQDPTIFVDQFS